MHAEEATRRFHEGACLLMLDAPDKLMFGIDHQVFMTGPKFQGVKMIPPGIHVITTTLAASDKFIPTVTKWLLLQRQQIYVARWDADTGRFVELEDEDEMMRYQLGVQNYDFDSGLAPYPLQMHKQWRMLSNHINSELLMRITPSSGYVDILSEAKDLSLAAPRTKAERCLVEQLQQGRQRMQARNVDCGRAGPGAESANEQQDDFVTEISAMDVDGPERCERIAERREAGATSTSGRGEQDSRSGRCHYTKIPASVRQAGATAAQLTAMNLDKSALLIDLFGSCSETNTERVLGELQFAFTTFLVGQSLEAFLQWKAILLLLFACDTAATETHQSLYTAFLKTLQEQLSMALPAGSKEAELHGEGDGDALNTPMESVGFEDSLQGLLDDSFLKTTMLSFFEMMIGERAALPADLWYQSELLRKYLEDTLGWSVTDDLDDGPVVVE